MCRIARILSVFGCLTLQTGCLYCAYPTLACTPAVQLDCSSNEVRAFRVDEVTWASASMGGFIGGEFHLPRQWDSSTSARLSELPTYLANEVPAQIHASLSYGFVYPLLIANGMSHTSRSVAVRMYRPGYELVEIRPWEIGTHPTWKLAPDLVSQERALDRLFPPSSDFGSVAPEHRNALLFGAAEYERLARNSSDEDLRSRLRDKAVYLRDRANK